ncbi:MAG: hypothetical protein AAGP08_05405 [Pseudomonadota bacterium]
MWVSVDAGTGKLKKTGWFSEEGNNVRMCGDGQVVVGMECRGSYCDDLNLVCAPVEKGAERYGCSSVSLSSTDEIKHTNWEGRHLVGVSCFGPYCERMEQHLCLFRMPETPVVTADVRAYPSQWKFLINNGGKVQITQGEKLNISTQTADSMTKEDERSLSIALGMSESVGTEIGPEGAKLKESFTVSSNVTTGVRQGVSQSRSDASAALRERSKEIACEWPSQPPEYSVWSWVNTATFNGEPVELHACLVACNKSSIHPPTWRPGENEGSCPGTAAKE